jgi:transcription elongation factor Elf1
MGFNADDDDADYEFSCPECGSDKVIVEMKDGSYFISQCKKCGFKRNQ